MKLQQCVFPIQIADNIGDQTKTRVNRAIPPQQRHLHQGIS